jgi:hypothetical protein
VIWEAKCEHHSRDAEETAEFVHQSGFDRLAVGIVGRERLGMDAPNDVYITRRLAANHHGCNGAQGWDGTQQDCSSSWA